MSQSIRVQRTIAICLLTTLSALATSAHAQDTPDAITTAPVVNAPIQSVHAANAPATFAVPVVTLTPAPTKPPLEPTGLSDIIRAKFPLAVQYKDFGQGWRELNYGGAFYFTKGDTAWLTDEEYLVVYKFAPRTNPLLDNTEYISTVTGNTPKFTRDDRFELTLLPTRELIPLVTRGNTGLRSFDATVRRPTLDPANFSVTFNQNLSLIYLHKIFEALTTYSQAYLNVMPPMESAFAARKALLPFAENVAVFTQPGTNQPYKANPLFSNRKREHLRKSASMVVFYEAQPAPDDLRAVLLYNGAVRRVDTKTWEKLRKSSLLD